MEQTRNLFERFDLILESHKRAIKYAEEHFEELHNNELKAPKTVMTSLCYDLGIVCPSMIRHKVISGNKRGRVIKEPPKEANYAVFSFNELGKPVAQRNYNKYGTYNAYYFFEFEGFTWAVALFDDKGTYSLLDVYRIQYENEKIKSFYSISDSSLHGEEYEYPDDETKPIICKWYYYVPLLVNSSKDIATGYRFSPMDEYLYEISNDKKLMNEYHKEEGSYVFTREYVSSGAKKSAKPQPLADSFERISEWLDNEFSKEIPLSAKGIYFSLSEGTEDGFGIELCYTDRFDADDAEWTCNVITRSSDELLIKTSGECEWQVVLEHSIKLLKKYFKGKKAILAKFSGIGVGFNDGDIEIL